MHFSILVMSLLSVWVRDLSGLLDESCTMTSHIPIGCEDVYHLLFENLSKLVMKIAELGGKR